MRKQIFCTVHFYLHVMSVKDLEIFSYNSILRIFFKKRVRIKIELIMIKIDKF